MIAILLIPAMICLLLAWARPKSVWPVLAIAAPLFIPESAIAEIVGSDSGTMLQKIWLAVVILSVAARTGWRMPPFLVWVLVGTYLIHALLTLLSYSPHASLSDNYLGTVFSGTAGLIYVWLVVVIDWRKIPEKSLALGVSLVPVSALIYGLLPQVLGMSSVLYMEWTGVPRLAGALPPAYFGALAAFGCVGAAWMWFQGHRSGGYWLIINLGFTAASGTRGALFFAAAVAGLALLSALRGRVRMSPPMAMAVVLGGVGAIGFLLPALIERTFTSSDGQAINASGRAVAWPYFYRVYEEMPWTGHGAGWAAIVHQHTDDPTISVYYRAPHNTFLQLMIDFGAPVMVLIVLLLLAIGVTMLRGSGYRLIGVGLLVGLPFYMYFDNVLTVSQPSLMLVMILSMIWAHPRATSPGPEIVEDAKVKSIARRVPLDRALVRARWP